MFFFTVPSFWELGLVMTEPSTIIHPDLFELAMIFYKRNENYYKMEKNQRLLELGLVVVSSKAARF